MHRLPAFFVFALSLGFAAAPFLTPDFGGFDPNLFPIPQNDPPVQPKGYAFAIWGVIYLWLIVSAAFGLIVRANAPDWAAMRAPLCVSLAIGIIWLPVAMVSPIWASILIWGMLLSALSAVFRAPDRDVFLAKYPLGLYAGWLSGASCVSLGLLAAGYGWMSQTTAAWVFVGLAIGLGVAIQGRLSNSPTYGAAVIWALVAIAVQNSFALMSVAPLALVGATILLWPLFKSLRAPA